MEDIERHHQIDNKEKKEIPSFDYLYDVVDSRYDSEFGDNKEKLEKYKAHYREVVGYAKEIGAEVELTEIEMAKLEVAAILHDLTKGDPAPEDVPEDAKPMYWLVAHGQTAADEIRQKVQEEDDSEIKRAMQSIVDMDPDNQNIEQVANDIASAIERHMGPNPGFMSDVLDGPENPKTGERNGGVNKALREGGYPEIKHPAPEEWDKVAQVLLAADMQSLAGPNGVKKVMGDREKLPYFRADDEVVVKGYKSVGVDITMGEVAFLSAYKTATDSRDMVEPYGDVAGGLKHAVRETEQTVFSYGGEDVVPADAIDKMHKYDKHRKARIIVEQYGGKQGITAEVERQLEKAGLDDIFDEPRDWSEIAEQEGIDIKPHPHLD